MVAAQLARARPPAHRDLARNRAPRYRRRRRARIVAARRSIFCRQQRRVLDDGKESDPAASRRGVRSRTDRRSLAAAADRTAVGYEGDGDYFLDTSGLPQRRVEAKRVLALRWCTAAASRAFVGISERVFSLVHVFDRAERSGVCARSCMTASGTTSEPRKASPPPASTSHPAVPSKAKLVSDQNLLAFAFVIPAKGAIEKSAAELRCVLRDAPPVQAWAGSAGALSMT